jgi:glutaredoxin 3
MPAKQPKVRVYSTPTCPYCIAAKAYLKENKVEFEDIDVSTDSAAADVLVKKSGQMGVPVIIIDDKTVIVGFDRDELKKALKLKK